jgi:hypothetical protein
LGDSVRSAVRDLVRDVPAEFPLVVLARLQFDDDPVTLQRPAPELPQQNGLSYAVQAGDDHRLLGPAAFNAFEQGVDGLPVVVASDDRFRLGAGLGV